MPKNPKSDERLVALPGSLQHHYAIRTILDDQNQTALLATERHLTVNLRGPGGRVRVIYEQGSPVYILVNDTPIPKEGIEDRLKSSGITTGFAIEELPVNLETVQSLLLEARARHMKSIERAGKLQVEVSVLEELLADPHKEKVELEGRAMKLVDVLRTVTGIAAPTEVLSDDTVLESYRAQTLEARKRLERVIRTQHDQLQDQSRALGEQLEELRDLRARESPARNSVPRADYEAVKAALVSLHKDYKVLAAAKRSAEVEELSPLTSPATEDAYRGLYKRLVSLLDRHGVRVHETDDGKIKPIEKDLVAKLRIAADAKGLQAQLEQEQRRASTLEGKLAVQQTEAERNYAAVVSERDAARSEVQKLTTEGPEKIIGLTDILAQSERDYVKLLRVYARIGEVVRSFVPSLKATFIDGVNLSLLDGEVLAQVISTLGEKSAKSDVLTVEVERLTSRLRTAERNADAKDDLYRRESRVNKTLNEDLRERKRQLTDLQAKLGGDLENLLGSYTTVAERMSVLVAAEKDALTLAEGYDLERGEIALLAEDAATLILSQTREADLLYQKINILERLVGILLPQTERLKERATAAEERVTDYDVLKQRQAQLGEQVTMLTGDNTSLRATSDRNKNLVALLAGRVRVVEDYAGITRSTPTGNAAKEIDHLSLRFEEAIGKYQADDRGYHHFVTSLIASLNEKILSEVTAKYTTLFPSGLPENLTRLSTLEMYVFSPEIRQKIRGQNVSFTGTVEAVLLQLEDQLAFVREEEGILDDACARAKSRCDLKSFGPKGPELEAENAILTSRKSALEQKHAVFQDLAKLIVDINQKRNEYETAPIIEGRFDNGLLGAIYYTETQNDYKVIVVPPIGIDYQSPVARHVLFTIADVLTKVSVVSPAVLKSGSHFSFVKSYEKGTYTEDQIKHVSFDLARSLTEGVCESPIGKLGVFVTIKYLDKQVGM